MNAKNYVKMLLKILNQLIALSDRCPGTSTRITKMQYIDKLIEKLLKSGSKPIASETYVIVNMVSQCQSELQFCRKFSHKNSRKIMRLFKRKIAQYYT